MTDYRVRTTKLLVGPVGEPFYSEMCTEVYIESEGAGEFVIVEQHARVDLGKIAINPDEWPALRDAINQMIGECEAHD